ncbi:unnamed protein product [Lactuca saligna]|uniref:AAA+ ATPase domain-containing protein n=1 Tax=Lactuca saligna TaxID=75948 RepID=A0AA35UTF2_LACSI|nr:unnamed protein product [Lactuca saligna]
MEIVTAFIKEFVEPLMVPVKKHLGYMISCTKYVRDMSIKMRELNVARQGVEDHLKWNTRTRLKNSVQVRKWLEDVGQINEKVENISNNINNVGSCFNLKDRHMLGKKVSSLIEDIDSAKTQHSLIDWTNYPIPLGKVDSMMIPTSIRLSHHNDFQSRIPTFIEALKALGPNHKSHMIALWGMGGVGKTTMMQMIKRAVKEKKMFNFIVEAVVGEKTEPHDIQEAVANYLGIELKENTQPARAEKLRESFEAISDGGKNKFLIILDDVWQSVDMEDIGLSPLPNQGVNFKVLMTSRNRDVCTKMGVETNSILNVKILTEEESQGFFRQFVELSNDVDPELNKIGEDIVSKCCGLPIAIKTMVCTLRNKSKDAWNDALSRLEHHDIHNVVPKVFEMSYDNLQGQETKSIFLLCGLFPEDFDIPTEDLVKYGLGLKLFSRVYTIIQARTRLNACIERLMHTNLLIKSDKVDCVKMHDLVHAFVLDMFSAVDHSSIVSQSTMSGWPESDISVRSCKRISLTCKGMSEFPRDLKFRNLSLLKLMHGDKSLRFPRDFYEEMENLQARCST